MEIDLVFEGGGAKGMVFVGALEVFEQAGHTMGRLLGTSAGAITAVLLAAGYSSSEMLDALNEKQDGKPVFSSFMSTPGPFSKESIKQSITVEILRSANLPIVWGSVEEKIDNALVDALLKSEKYRHLFSFVELGGWFSARNFVTWLEDKLNSGLTGDGLQRAFGSMTLAEFNQQTGKEVTMVASDTTDQRMLILNHRTAPNCPVVWAVRMSMSIPLVWQEVAWKSEWGLYGNKDMTGHLIVDGGLLSNFPIELLLPSGVGSIADVMGEKNAQHVIGLLIDEKLSVPGAPPKPEEKKTIDLSMLKTTQRIGRLVGTMTDAHDSRVIDAQSRRIVRLPAKGYGTVEFDMSDARRNALVAGGRQAMKEYLDGLEFATSSKDIEDMVTATRVAKDMLEGIFD